MSLEQNIQELASSSARALHNKIAVRKLEMQTTRLQAIVDSGFVPIRLMFYTPNREQALQIQATLKTLYLGVGGQYHAGNEAWEFVKVQTGVDLKQILEQIGTA
jgi:hypothetical protein